jgi:nucleoside phosphorylase
MTGNEVSANILAGNFSKTEISEIISAINERRGLDRQLKVAQARVSLRSGVKALVRGITSNGGAINGSIVKIIKVKKTNADVEIVDSSYPAMYRVGQKIGIPVTCLTPQI